MNKKQLINKHINHNKHEYKTFDNHLFINDFGDSFFIFTGDEL